MIAGRAKGRNVHSSSLKAAGRSGDRTGDLVPATRAAGSPGHLDLLLHRGRVMAWSEQTSRVRRDVSVYEGAFPIGDEILLHWVSAGTKGKEVLLYLASSAFL